MSQHAWELPRFLKENEITLFLSNAFDAQVSLIVYNTHIFHNVDFGNTEYRNEFLSTALVYLFLCF